MSSAVRAALALAACILLAAALLAGMHVLTRQRIAMQQQEAALAALAVVLPPSLYDNHPLDESIALRAPRWLGSEETLHAWRARRGTQASALVLEAVAPDGYAGPIHLLIGVDARSHVLGVRITAHRETPGLGDAFDAQASPWLEGFVGRSLADPARTRWALRRDGGDFDQFTGATVTPRAVVQAVRRVLDYLAAHGAQLQTAPTGAMLEHDDGPAD